jgi:hypothetical protein
MAKLFRLACAIEAYLNNPDKTQRPPRPRWLLEEFRERSTRNQAHSFNYWTKIYWATPPWISELQIAEMRRISTNAPPGYHIDHIVPLTSPYVCGLNVPWNLQYLPEKVNLIKSNNHWPGHPCENVDMFGDSSPAPHQLRLI